MYPVKIPAIIQPFAKDLLWKVDTHEPVLYLTFDDGPTPGVTEDVLQVLHQYQAKATFFCLGKNVEAHPELFAQIKAAGHTIGNHSYNHPDGWKTSAIAYAKNALRAQQFIQSVYYRPPYGRISRAQSSLLKKRFKIVMYHIISGDFDPSITKEKCLDNVLHYAEKGSIIVFHDSIKASAHVHYALRGTLEHFSKLGYRFEALP
ncbi:MAG TPA: polysaccharide deacetylase family protein [Flavobacteriales bacterium]